MKLKELSAATETSTASIKYYLRIGLLRPGRKLNQTTASYDDSHVARLELIAALRQIVGAPTEEIARLTELIDDPDTGILPVLEAAQSLGSGISLTGTRPETEIQDTVSALITRQRWPARPSLARRAVEQVLADMDQLGIHPSPDYLARVVAALDEISGTDLDFTVGGAGETHGGVGSRDRMALRTAVGTHQYSRLIVALLRLGHSSHSIRRFGEGLT